MSLPHPRSRLEEDLARWAGVGASDSLPQELYYLIVQHLDGDKQALKACALASSHWLVPARSLLFHDITITRRNVKKFLPLLLSPLCTFAPLVRSLTLDQEYIRSEDWINSVIDQITIHIQHVEFLTIYHLSWEHLSPTAMSSLLAGFQHVQTLHIGGCAWGRIDGFASFVCSFPNLRHLVCESDNFNLDTDEENPLAFSQYIIPASLTSLYVTVPRQCLLRYFISQPSLRHIRSLGFRFTDSKLEPYVSNLASAVGPSLHNLIFFPPITNADLQGVVSPLVASVVLLGGTPFMSTPSETGLTLKHHPNLKTLRIRLPGICGLPIPGFQYPLTWIPKLISTCPSVQLARVVFDINNTPELVQVWPAEMFTRVVLDSQIQQVVFLVRFWIEPELVQGMKKVLGDLDVRGILKFQAMPRDDPNAVHPWREWL